MVHLTMNILEIAKNNAIPHDMPNIYLFPLTFVGFGVLGAMFPFHTWSPDGHASAPTAVSMLHAGVLDETRWVWLFPCCDVPDAVGQLPELVVDIFDI